MNHFIIKLKRALSLFTGTFVLIPALSHVRAADQINFQRHDLLLGSEERQTILTGSFFGGAMHDLLVIHKNKQDVGCLLYTSPSPRDPH